MRIEDWRYIRYADRGEELYHTSEDPDERDNLISDAGYRSMISEMREFLPKNDAPPAKKKSDFIFDYGSYSWKLR
ncbi:MAG: hypothetical protein HN368_07095 [Spirochaetales bacterium]|nr:hypothetical protein [Spirochaetales bacterium]